MTKKKLGLALIAFLTTTGVCADEYLGAGLAYESAYSYDSGMALVISGGRTFENIEAGPGKLAFESEFTFSLISPSSTYYNRFNRNYSIDLTYFTLAGYAAYIYDITPDLYVKPRLGLVYTAVSVSNTYGAYGLGAYGNGLGLAVGLGAGYKLTRELNTYLDFTLLNGTGLRHLTLGVEYHYNLSDYI